MMKPVTAALAALAATLSSACSPGPAEVDVTTARSLIAQGSQVLDVRTRPEWEQSRIEGSVRIDVKDPAFATRVKSELDPARPVLVYCRSGVRSARAAGILRDQGFQEVRSLHGGILAWNRTHADAPR